ncbi:hypothetical protein QBC37DRAFT_375899 [Rhypophila decipiens]|uniref:RING-type domain-containing protein n=1 Tax=Rhypophila decipiens TaxID=261697 RepID=A0AAN6Y7J5_9PEZI|nr:hypothetical protein QBC37DRAFT_375899 [Rhypophila decipiens]
MPGPERPASPATGDKWPTFWAAISAVFPAICPDHARQSAPDHDWDAAGFIAHTLDQQEAGHSYPTQAPAQKRKRAEEDDDLDEAGLDDEIKNQGNLVAQKGLARRAEGFPYLSTYSKATSFLLQIAFPTLYVKDIETTFKENQLSLHHTYLALRAELSKPAHERRFMLKKGRPKTPGNPDDVHGHIKQSGRVDANTKRRAEDEALAEYKAIHALHLAKEGRETLRGLTLEAEAERERLNEAQAIAEGLMGECQCCFGDHPMNRMVYCTGDSPHYVCYECAKNFAKSKIGMSQWELTCFAVEDCQGTFSHAHRAKFLDDNLTKALDRLEQEHVLQQAGIDLAQCPFCPYAAEYPPVEVNREFTCDNPECGAVSCRLCKALTHIPKSCEEFRSENAAESARHRIEEDMTLALIRKCNKCKTPYVKLDGCNKIICSKCRAIQCYICQQTIKDYTHFRDANTACYERLHDNVDNQLVLEVEKAEKVAREKILKENAHIREDHLGFKFSATVQKEEEARRTQALAANRNRHPPGALPVIPDYQERLMQADAENRARLAAARREQAAQEQPARQEPAEEVALEDYQIQLMALENQNQARLRHARMGLPREEVRQVGPLVQEQVVRERRRQERLRVQDRQQAQLAQQQAQQQAQQAHEQARQQARQAQQQAQQAQERARQQARQARQQVEQAVEQARQVRRRVEQGRRQAMEQARQGRQARQAEQAEQVQQRVQQQAQPQPAWFNAGWAANPINLDAAAPVPVGLGWQPPYMVPAAQPAMAPQMPPPPMVGAYYIEPQAMPVAGYPVDGLPQMGMNMVALPIRATPPQVVIDLTGEDAQQAAGFGHNIHVDVGANWGY